ncbi:hypothetical protein [Thermogymnomonas acidicola]|uniref:hypothetical protein n=1 Tax=Thermogymnomonas acidicola TaxID=399579 RepID=UPI001396C981|nr:hypothetical protein [Thermogymnomonas acidicola]
MEREWLLYLIRVLWKNQEVRSALIDIYRQGGYSFLGKAIAQKYLEEGGNMREAISILENIQGNFPPRDVDNARRLASCYETAGDSGAAVSLLTKTLSLLDEPAQRRQVGGTSWRGSCTSRGSTTSS